MAKVALLRGRSTGGISAHVETLREAIVQKGDDVVVIDDAQIDLRRFNALNPKTHEQLASLVSDCDVIHAHGIKSAVASLQARLKVPVVVTLHNPPGGFGSSATALVLSGVVKHALNNAAYVIATSSDLAGSLVPAGVPSEVIMPFGPQRVPQTDRLQVRTELGFGDDDQLVLWVGRMHKQKQPFDFVDQIGDLVRKGASPKVVMVGTGPLQSKVALHVERSGLGGWVSCIDRHDDIAGLIAAAEVLVCSSSWESGPLVISEAMQLGTVVVSTRVGFVDQLIADKVTGRVVDDVSGLATAIDSVLSDVSASNEMAVNARVRVDEVLNRQQLIDQTLDVYKAVVER